MAALRFITGQITTCVFALDKLAPVPSDVTVKIDGATIPRDPSHAAGWDLTANATAVQLFGAACEQVKAGTALNLEIVYGCPR